MAHFWKDQINKALLAMGLDVLPHSSYRHVYRLRQLILDRKRISLVVDAGAGQGGYVHQLRKSGYRGKAVSFEPMRAPFERLVRRAASDPLWTCRNQALGSDDGASEINVSDNSVSSSLLPITEQHTQASSDTKYVRTERIQVARLDSIRAELIQPGDRVFLKLDVQGFEKQVLAGAAQSLGDIYVIECELSLAPLYQNGPLYREMIDEFERLGFRLTSLDRGFCDFSTGQLFQMDGIFERED
jgi:FkbM family methyltransferase